MTEPWRIQLLGGLRMACGEHIVTRFRTQKTAGLLAFLAYHKGQTFPRQALTEIFWPEAAPDAARHSLSQALSSLRNQLEPPGVPAGAFIVADRFNVALNADAFHTDVEDVDRTLRAAAKADQRPPRRDLLTHAVRSYGGPLLPGLYDDWVMGEQRRIEECVLLAIEQLLDLLRQDGELEQAVEFARTAARIAPLQEQWHLLTMQMLATAGNPLAALRHFHEAERVLGAGSGEGPSPELRDAARALTEQIATQKDSAPTVPEAAAGETLVGRPSLPVPTGTVTFLFTEIADADAIWNRAGQAQRSILTLHHAILRREFRRNGGHEVKDSGVAFTIAFAGARDALACAVAVQRELAVSPWPPELDNLKVRMALASGDVELDQDHYRGAVLSRGADILSAAHGGQILCSEATAGLIRHERDASVKVTELGPYRLPATNLTERLWQVDYPGMDPGRFPRILADRLRAGSLPLQVTRFFGRDRELALITGMAADSPARLITLSGPGGTGKTRLALEVAARLMDSFSDAIWFVPLADITDPGVIPEMILGALGAPPLESLDPLDQTVGLLEKQPCLLVLDNFEHLIDGGLDIVLSLMERVPTLKCLVTSRHVLGVAGETEFSVQPLPTPGLGDSAATLGVHDSVRMFVDRAQAVKPDFQVTNLNAPALAELCCRLEGIPLAIELAAARAQVLTPAQMLAQLAHRFEFLVTRRRGIAERQKTLRATMDWSYRLLAPELKRFFRGMAVFRGGCTIAAAEAVCAEPLALDCLAQLRDCSLVQTVEEGAEIRFRLLESLREYAMEELEQSREEALDARRRHAEFYLEHVDSRLAMLRNPEEASALREIWNDLDNLRAAVDLARDDESVLYPRLALSLGRYQHRRGFAQDAAATIDSALQRVSDLLDSQPALHGQLLRERAGLHYDAFEWDAARRTGTRALEVFERLNLRDQAAHTENLLGLIAQAQGSRVEAKTHYLRALAHFQQSDDLRHTAIAHNNLGWLNCETPADDSADARHHLEEALRLRRELGDRRGLAETLTNLGMLAYHSGDWHAAWESYAEALEHDSRIENAFGVGRALFNMGEVAVKRSENHAACRMFAAAERVLGEVRSNHAAEALAQFECTSESAGYSKSDCTRILEQAACPSLNSIVAWALAAPVEQLS